MGIPLLQKTVNKLGYMKKVDYIYNHKHIIIDMNNQIYKLLQLQRKYLTPLKKFQIIQQYCQKLITISKQRGIHFYIVLDQMTEFSKEFSYDFSKEYEFLKPYSIKISNGFFQVYQTLPDGTQELYGLNILSKINFIKPQLEKKISKNKKDSTQLKIDIQNGGTAKNDNYSFLLATKYNYYLYETMFSGIPNIELIIANTEADFKIAQLTQQLIQKGIPPQEICIHSQDSDLLILQTGVDIQQNIFIMKYQQGGLNDKLKYYYLHQSDYILKQDQQKTINQELEQPTTEEERQAILRKACDDKNFSILISDVLYQHFNIIEQVSYYQRVEQQDIKNINHIKLIFEMYEQLQFNTSMQSIEQQKQTIQRNTYFKDVLNDTWVNPKLSQKETVLKLYFKDLISYETFRQRMILIEQQDQEERLRQLYMYQHHSVKPSNRSSNRQSSNESSNESSNNDINSFTNTTNSENSEPSQNGDPSQVDIDNNTDKTLYQLYSSEGSQETFE